MPLNFTDGGAVVQRGKEKIQKNRWRQVGREG